MTSANRGEWSELYALGYLLLHGGGYAADEQAKIDKTIFYKVLEIVDNPSGHQPTTYTVEDSEVHISKEGFGIVKILKSDIAPGLRKFFDDLVAKTDARAFSLTSGDALMAMFHKAKLSAASTLSQDLQLVLEDRASKVPSPLRGFSIKSEIGAAATVLNASHSTNITYEVIGPTKAPEFSDPSSVKKNIKALNASGFSLKFDSFDSNIFHESLANIDSNLPQYLSELMLSYYENTTRTRSILSLCEHIWGSGSGEDKLKIGKIKKFLSSISMGLRPNQIWSGYPQDFGGLLLVKENGDVLFYYLYNLKLFEEYLYSMLKFDTPSTSRHGFGQLYEVQGKQFIKLNLQIRF
jgi:hypothetical protein